LIDIIFWGSLTKSVYFYSLYGKEHQLQKT
jgi:hypothetical protein